MTFKPIRKADKSILSFARSRPCAVCGRSPADASHIKTRGSGGPDTAWNVTSKCRKHHIEWGQYGPRRFFLRYPQFLVLLRSLGWEFDGVKLWHPGLRPESGADPAIR